MFVPVTTKPYLNNVNFIILQQGIPAFFLSIKEKLINILLPVYRIVQITSFRVFWFLKTWITDSASLPTMLAELYLLRFELHLIRSQRESRSLRFGDNSSNASSLQWPHGALQGIHVIHFVRF
jgi:hypothetical protein